MSSDDEAKAASPRSSVGEKNNSTSITPRTDLDSSSGALSARKKWTRPEKEDVGDIPDMNAGPKKPAKKGVAWDKKLTQEELSTKTQQASAVLAAMGSMKTADLTKFTATEGDEEAAAKMDISVFRGKHLVNILSYNGSDKDVDYGEIFGDDADATAGVKIWACENWKLKPVDEDEYGNFHSEDCYIVLHVSDPWISKSKNIHMWIGKDATHDKLATCAIRAVMLNSFLSSQCRMHREEQGRESELFISYFFRYHGLQVHDGSVCVGGFKNHEQPAHVNALYLVQPHAAVRLKRVDLSRKALDERYTFILDANLVIYQWNGRKSPRAVRFKAMEMCRNINDFQRDCKARVQVLEQGEEDAEFIGHFSEDDLKMEVEFEVHARMFQTYINDQNKPNVQPVEPPFKKAALDSRHCLILDSFSEIFVWVGRYSSAVEKKVASLLAQRLAKTGDERPPWVLAQPVRDGAEPVTFRQKFSDWYDVLPLKDYSKPPPRKIPPSLKNLKQPRIDVEALFDGKDPLPPVEVDDGSGVIEIWNLERAGPKFVKLPITERSHFYSGDCYLVLYTYYDEKDYNAQKYIAYFWEGRDANPKWYPSFLFGFFPLLQKKMSGKGHGNRLTQQHIYESKEPDHFLQIFKGRLIIHRGNRRTHKAREDESVQLFDVKAVNENRVHAIEVEAFPEYLHSRDVFILLTPTKVYVWNGYCSRSATRDAAEKVADLLVGGRDDPIVMDEDLEEDAFWDVLGEKKPFADSAFYQKYELNETRLFHCTTATGVLQIAEVHGFAQADFTDDSCFWLDAHTELYVWYGSRSFGGLRILSLKYAQEYAAYASEVRGKDVAVVEVVSGAEPQEFKWQFHAWKDPRPFHDPRAPRLQQLLDEDLEDRQLEEFERNLSREERFDTRSGEFDDRPFIDTEFSFKGEVIDMQRVGTEWRLDVVLLPGVHVYEILVDGEVEPPQPNSTRPLVEHEGRQVYQLRINSRGLVPTVHTFRFPFPQPLQRRVKKQTVKIRKKIVKEKIKKKSRPKQPEGDSSVAATNGEEKKDEVQKEPIEPEKKDPADDSVVDYTIVKKEVLIVPDETAEERDAREASEKRWAAAAKVQIRGSFTAKMSLAAVLQNPQMKLLGPNV